MFSSLYMVLGMERMHFLAMNDFPVVVVTLACVWWSRIEATGEDRWMLLAPTSWARPLAIDCAPTGESVSGCMSAFCGFGVTITVLESQMLTSRGIVRTDGQKPVVTSAVFNKPSCGFLG